MPDVIRRFIACLSRLVPAWARREFRAEWEAELETAWIATDMRLSWGDRRRFARRALGALPDAWCLFRQQWSLDMILQDIRFAFRMMRLRVGYTAIVIVTLALGIGASTAMFSAIHAVLLRPLPFTDPDRLVRIWENDRINHKPRYSIAPANYTDWQTQTRTFENIAAYLSQTSNLTGAGEEPFHANTGVVTPNFFDTLGVRPLLGRTLTSADGVPPNNRVLVLSFRTWQTHFGADRNVLDRTVKLGDMPYRIVAVMPEGFAFPDHTIDVWRPLGMRPELMATRAQHFFDAIGRIKPSVTFEQAKSDLESVAIAAQKQYPQTNDQRGTTMVPLQEGIVGDVRDPLYFLAAAVGLLLLIACANVANLMLVQSAARRRELAVRSALGADRYRLARQLLIEGLLLALVAGAAGVALAAWAAKVLARVAVDYVPRVTEVRIDPTVLAFALVISLGTGLVFAIAPALRASRSHAQNDLRDGARGSIGSGRWMRNLLVVMEFAAAIVLVVGAALLLESFWRVLQVRPGFETAHVLVVETEMPQARYDDDKVLQQFYGDLIQRLSAVPGVRAAALVNNLPLSGQGWTSWLTIENRPRPQGEPPEVGYRVATPGYLAAMQIPLLQGRWIADSDTPESMKVVVVNNALAQRFFPAGDAIGSRIRLGPNPKSAWWTIVGVVGDVRHAGPEVEPAPESFKPFAQDSLGDLTLVVRADGDRAATASTVKSVARTIDPAVVLWRMQWMDGLMDEHLAPRRLSLLLVEGFAALALGLALLGIYGVMSYTVGERVPEIGVRMALGAEPREIYRMVIGDGARLAIPGLLAGVGIALAVTRIARGMLFEVSPADPLAFTIVSVGGLAIALMACFVPARRAAHVDPLQAIRSE
jgi:putative ABC transport system permease protein